MSFFNTDYSENNNDFGPIAEGSYEAIIKAIKHDANKNGKEYLQFDLAIRNDLDKVQGLEDTNGKYHNRVVPMRFYPMKDTGQFNIQHLQMISEGARIPEHTNFESIDDFINKLTHKPVKIYVNVEDNEYQGKVTKQNRVPAWNFHKTEFPNVQHEFKQKDEQQNNNNLNQSLGKAEQASSQQQANPFGQSNDQIDINDDDLPF